MDDYHRWCNKVGGGWTCDACSKHMQAWTWAYCVDPDTLEIPYLVGCSAECREIALTQYLLNPPKPPIVWSANTPAYQRAVMVETGP